MDIGQEEGRAGNRAGRGHGRAAVRIEDMVIGKNRPGKVREQDRRWVGQDIGHERGNYREQD